MTYEERMVKRFAEEYNALEERPCVEICEAEELRIPMSDGVLLRTVVQKPQGEGPFPTIIMRSCYPSNEGQYRLHAREYCSRGFAFVYQFCRGTGGSDGEWVPNVHEREDGKVTLDWLDEQAWVESIGYFGCSYLALTGWAVADIVPEKVKTLYLTHYGTDRFTSAYSSGCFRQDVLTSWAMENAGVPIKADFRKSAAFMPQIEVDETVWGCRLDWYRDWITHTDRDDSYWTEGFWGELAEIPERVTVPVYIGGGWYDHHLGSTLRTWKALSPLSKQHSTLRLGAWNHDFQSCTPGVPTRHLENSDIASAYHWFRMILVDKILPDTQIKSYIVNEDEWLIKNKDLDVQQEKKYFVLTEGKKLLQLESTLSCEVNNQWSYVYNPKNPVPSHGGESLLWSWDDIGSLKQPPCGWRDDVLSFVSEPLSQDMIVLGSIKVELYVSSDASDTAFSAKLMEIRPDGSAYHVRSGITTLAYRSGADFPRGVYKAGQMVKVEINFWDIGWCFKTGTRLRLDISSSDFPQYSIHSNYPGVWSVQTKTKPAVQTVYSCPGNTSAIIFPIISNK